MNWRFLSLTTCSLLLTGMSLSACRGHGTDPGSREIEGVLLLKGSEPHGHWVLAVSDTEQWELLGLNGNSARSLQTQRIQVKARFQADVGSASLLPALMVIEVRPLKN